MENKVYFHRFTLISLILNIFLVVYRTLVANG
jgi:hypothetical protein